MDIPAAVSGEQPLISVWLPTKKGGYEVKKFFRCCICGHKVFAFYNSDKGIQLMSGKGESTRPPIEIQCNGVIDVFKEGRKVTTRCRTLYRIE